MKQLLLAVLLFTAGWHTGRHHRNTRYPEVAVKPSPAVLPPTTSLRRPEPMNTVLPYTCLEHKQRPFSKPHVPEWALLRWKSAYLKMAGWL